MLERTFLWCIAVLFPLIAAPLHAAPLSGCGEYVKLGIPGTDGNLLCRKGYALAHNPKRKTPFWVAEHLTEEKASASLTRSGKFQADPDLDEGERAELSDYKGSGFDRGHMAPSADMQWDAQAMAESFYLSNMAPQVGKGMNQGIWKNLEEKIRKWPQSHGDLYIYTGPIYPARGLVRKIGGNKVAVPTHFYKVVYSPSKVEAIAFIMPNHKLRSSDMASYIVSIRDVEEKTRLDFLSDLETGVQDEVETHKAEALWTK